MKKILIPLLLIVIGLSARAQSEKKPPPPPPPIPPKVISKYSAPTVITAEGKTADEFYTRNPFVSEVSMQGNIITVKKKEGTIEQYDMSKKEKNKGFKEKYGASPIPPPQLLPPK